jgi:predicted MPP superfamily phosphohydrolase
LFIVIFLLIDDFLRLIRWLISLVYQKKDAGALPSGTGITRLEFLTKTGMVIASIPFFTMLYGIVRGPYRFEVRRMRLHLPKLPNAFNGLKVVQISDMHLGSFSGPHQVEKAIKLIKKENPDIILFTGDLVNDKSSETDDYVNVLRQIQAPMGVYSVLGNHDYGDYFQWRSKEEKVANLNRLKDLQKDLGWKLLMNEHVMIEKDGEKIGLIGIENWSSLGNFPKYGKMADAVKNMPEVPVKILMSHDPTHWDSEVTKKYKDIDFTLAGHTHGMQFGVEIPGFRWSPAQYIYKQWAGLYQNGSQLIYVNRGFGFLGYPGRVGIMPEISVFELTNKA